MHLICSHAKKYHIFWQLSHIYFYYLFLFIYLFFLSFYWVVVRALWPFYSARIVCIEHCLCQLCVCVTLCEELNDDEN